MKAITFPIVIFLLSIPMCWAQTPEDHEPTILGLIIGMDANQVLQKLQRVGDRDEEKDGEIIIYWQFESGEVLQVNFWQDHVSHLGLRYASPRTVTELGLVAQVDQRSSLDARDPRGQYGYREGETRDKDRIVWSRSVPSGSGYDLEIQFLSPSRKELGERRGQFVEFKYLSLPGKEKKKFRKSIKGKN